MSSAYNGACEHSNQTIKDTLALKSKRKPHRLKRISDLNWDSNG